MSKMASTVEILERQLREQMREEKLLLWEQHGTNDYLQEMMRLTLAIVDNFEKKRREEVANRNHATDP